MYFLLNRIGSWFIHHSTQRKVSIIEEEKKIVIFSSCSKAKLANSRCLRWLNSFSSWGMKTQNSSVCSMRQFRLLTNSWNPQIAVFSNTCLDGSNIGTWTLCEENVKPKIVHNAKSSELTWMNLTTIKWQECTKQLQVDFIILIIKLTN